MRRHWNYYTNGEKEITIFEGDEIPEGFFKGRKPFSKETKEKQSQSAKKRGSNNKGKKLSDQARKNMSIAKQKFLANNPDWVSPTQFEPGVKSWNKGIPCKEETKLKISLAHQGKKYSEEVNKSKGRPGIKRTDETKKKLSDARKKYYFLHPEEKEKISQRLSGRTLSDETKKKISVNRKKYSGSLSKAEDEAFYVLTSFFGKDVIRQYKDSRYPFFCDFYIKSVDLFIECNFHWTHGLMPYNDKDINCLNLLEEWKTKAITNHSSYFNSAIECWTKRDVLKCQKALENNLNYILLYNREDLKCLIKLLNQVRDIDDFKSRIQRNDFFWYRNF